MIEAGVEVNIKAGPSYNKKTPLMAACDSGNIELCKYLIEKGADVNIKTKGYNGTPLIAASWNIELCKYLIEEKRADVNIKSEGYNATTPLIATCFSGNIEVCKYLIEKGANVNINTDWYLPLIAACNSKNIELCKYLI